MKAVVTLSVQKLVDVTLIHPIQQMKYISTGAPLGAQLPTLRR
jgi:hypothetical protein